MKSLSFILVLAISLISTVNAESKDGRTCRIVFPERPKDAPKFAYLFDGQSSRRVTLPSMNFSEVIELPKGDLTIRMTADKLIDFEELPIGAPRLEVAENIQDFYLLVTADPSNEMLPLQLNLVNTSDGEFKPGQTLWCNRTNHAISAKLGEREITVAPNSRKVSPSPVTKSGHYRAEFSYQPEAKGDFQKITEQHWWHDVKSRHLGFIVNTGGELPKIFFYRDFR